MSFFNLFKKKEQGPTITDKIWMSQAAKEQACIVMAKENSGLTFVAWSGLTYDRFQKLLNEEQQLNAEIMLAYDALPSRMRGKTIVFLEHHFYRQKEIDLLESFNCEEALFLNSLDDPVFLLFQSDRIKTMLQRMDHDENEPLQHAMITKSIGRAQEKIATTGLPENTPEPVKKMVRIR